MVHRAWAISIFSISLFCVCYITFLYDGFDTQRKITEHEAYEKLEKLKNEEIKRLIDSNESLEKQNAQLIDQMWSISVYRTNEQN